MGNGSSEVDRAQTDGLEVVSCLCCLCFASNVIFKDSIINFRGAQARNFQQLNMGFGRGSSSQTRQGGLGWLGKHRQTDQKAGHGEADWERSRGQRRDVPHCILSVFPSDPLLILAFSFPSGIQEGYTRCGLICCDSAVRILKC